MFRSFLPVLLIVHVASAYFIITEPARNTRWKNNAVNLVSWQKGALDGIDSFDIEFARLAVDGNLFAAKDVPSSQTSLNFLLQDVPAGDDYYVLLINSTHGVIHAVSSRFTILDSSDSSAPTGQAPFQDAPTVTVSGRPNPTQEFATTFPARVGVSNGATGGWNEGSWRRQLVAVGATIFTSLLGVVLRTML